MIGDKGDANTFSVLVQFFQVEDNPQKDLYQIGFVIALVYLLVQFLRQILWMCPTVRKAYRCCMNVYFYVPSAALLP